MPNPTLPLARGYSDKPPVDIVELNSWQNRIAESPPSLDGGRLGNKIRRIIGVCVLILKVLNLQCVPVD